jgi:hypothetical protein
VYEAHLLRRTYREGGKVKNETLANLSRLPRETVELVRRSLRGEQFLSAVDGFEIERSLPHGHVAAVLGMARRLELARLLDRQPSPERSRVLALVVQQLLAPGSKLACRRRYPDLTGRRLQHRHQPRRRSSLCTPRLRRGRPHPRRGGVRGLESVPARRRPHPPHRADRAAQARAENVLDKPLARAPRRSTTACSPRTCSSAGRRCGPSPASTASSRPTTTPRRPARRRHLPQALPRQPVRAGRAHDRATALRLGHLPPAGTLALRLPHRRPHRQHPRRSHPGARLIQPGT